MFKVDLRQRVVKALILAVAVTLCGGGAVHAKVTKPGGSSNKVHPYPGPVHGPGSSHNPIIHHGPLHGAGTSHNPIVVPKNCNDPNTVCRRP